MSGGGLGSLVAKLVLEARQFRTEFAQAATEAEGHAGRVMQATQALSGAVQDAINGQLDATSAATQAMAVLGPVAAAVAAIGITAASAYAEAGRESQGFTRAVAMTGHAAGVTSSSLADMARNIDGVVGTQAQAAQTLTQMAESGKIAGENMQFLAQSAIEMERGLGQSIDKSVSIFETLADAPVKASLKLNETLHYLTATTYDLIRAADDLGDKERAASLAQETYAGAMRQRAAEVEKSLGTMERAWRVVRDSAREAWDSMLNVGRSATTKQQLDAASKNIDSLEAQLRSRSDRGLATGDLDRQLTAAKALQETLRTTYAQEELNAAAQADKVTAENAYIDLMQEGTKHLGTQEKMQRAVAEATQTYQTALKNGTLTQEQRNKLEQTYLAIVTDITKAKETKEKSGRSGKSEAEKELERESAALARHMGLNSDYLDQLRLLESAKNRGTISEERYIEAVQHLIAVQPMAKKLIDDQKKADDAAAKAAIEHAKAREKHVVSLQTAAEKIEAETKAQIEHNERLGLSAAAVAELDAAKLEMLATDKELQAIKVMDKQLDEQQYDLLKRQAKGYRELAEAKRAGGQKQAALEWEKESEKAAQRAQDAWERSNDRIGDSLTDALMRGFEGGKDSAENFFDSLENMAKSLVLKPTLKFMLSPVSAFMNGMVGGFPGSSGGAGGGMGMLSNASSFMGMGGSFSAGMSAGMGAWFGEAGLMGALDAGGIAIGAGNILGGLGTIAGALGPIALGLGVLASLVKDDSGTLHTGGMAQYSKEKGLETSVERGEFGINIGMMRGEATEKAVSEIAKGIVGTLDGLAQAFGDKAGFEVATGYADDTSKDGAWGGLRISRDGQDLLNWDKTQTGEWAAREFADGEEGWKQYLQAVATDTKKVLEDMDLPGWADDLLTSLGDAPSMEALAGVVQQINAGAAAFEQLGKHVVGFADMSDEALTALSREMGGPDKVATEYESFRQNYYSEGERKRAKESDVAEALAEVGLQMPKTRAEFRALVEAQQALGESGSKALAVLLSVDEAFAELTPAAEDAASSMAGIGDKIKESIGFTGDSLAGLLRDAVKGASSQEEASRNASSAFEQQIYDGLFNAMTQGVGDMLMQAVVGPLMESLAMGGQVASMSMTTGGVAAATGMASGGAVAGAGMATGGSVGGAATASGGAAAAGAMASGGAAAAAAMAAGGAAAGSRVDDAVARAREYMGMFTSIMKDPSIRESLSEVGDMVGDVAGELWKTKGTFYQDAAFVSGAAGGMSGAAQQVGKAWNDLTDALMAEVERIRGMVRGEESAASFAKAQADFAIATAQARADDQDAAKRLPELSRNMLELAASNTKSAAELRYLQAVTASSLQQTAELLAKKHGVKLPAYADGGYHAGGWALVGENGPEFAYMPPSRIYTAQDSAMLRGEFGRGGGDELIGLLLGVVSRMVERMEMLERNSRNVADLVGQWNRYGLPVKNAPKTKLEVIS